MTRNFRGALALLLMLVLGPAAMGREYSAATGRYIQADPIGMTGGLSRYGYANQNPLRYTDPTGLATEEEIRRAVATLRCSNPDEFRKLAKLITMTDLERRAAGRTDWLNNIELNSRLYGDSSTPVDEFLRGEFMQTLAHEMLHVNESTGSRLLSNSFRTGNPLGHFHRKLDEKAVSMTTPLLEQFRKALNDGDTGCTCAR